MRKLTVSTLRRQNSSLYRGSYTAVPYIRLSGSWLANAGIMPGQRIQVEVNGCALQITPAVHEGSAR